MSSNNGRTGYKYLLLRNRLKQSERGGTCHLCGKPIDMGLVHPDRGSWVMDHIKPVSEGGLSTWDNVAPAHMSCNSSRGSKPLNNNGRGKATRDW